MVGRMFKILFAALLLSGAALSSAAPLNAWNLNLGAVGGTNATQIGIVTLNGYSELDQIISGNSAFGQHFTFSGSLQWVQYQQSGAFNPLGLGLPSAYTDLYFRFDGLSGNLDNKGNAAFNPGIGVIKLYLGNGGSLIPDAQALELASYKLASASTASDIAYYDGFGLSPMFNLSFQLVSAFTGLFTDNNGAPILPLATFDVGIDGLLDLSVLINPTPVPSGAGTSTNILVNAGQIRAVNVDPTAIPGLTVPEPATVMLIAAGLVGIFAVRRRIAV